MTSTQPLPDIRIRNLWLQKSSLSVAPSLDDSPMGYLCMPRSTNSCMGVCRSMFISAVWPMRACPHGEPHIISLPHDNAGRRGQEAPCFGGFLWVLFPSILISADGPDIFPFRQMQQSAKSIHAPSSIHVKQKTQQTRLVGDRRLRPLPSNNTPLVT